jgi:hypothetical protein
VRDRGILIGIPLQSQPTEEEPSEGGCPEHTQEFPKLTEADDTEADDEEYRSCDGDGCENREQAPEEEGCSARGLRLLGRRRDGRTAAGTELQAILLRTALNTRAIVLG